jgi:hypothetical protein
MIGKTILFSDLAFGFERCLFGISSFGFFKLKRMDFNLPEELQILKDTVRRFVDKELIPHSASM